MRQIKASEIDETTGACPYCGDQVSIEPTDLCCGEVHGEEAYILTDGELVLASEVEVIDDGKELLNEQH